VIGASFAMASMKSLQLQLRPQYSYSRLSIVTLLVCFFVGMSSAERTCGSHFDDVGSSSLLAPIVVEGRARRVLYETGELLPDSAAQPSPGVSSVIFDRLRLYKGQLTTSSGDQVRSIRVGHFDVVADGDACVAPLPQLRRLYVLFLRFDDRSHMDGSRANISGVKDDDADRQRLSRYQLSAFPVRKSRRNIETVVEFTNCSRCGM